MNQIWKFFTSLRLTVALLLLGLLLVFFGTLAQVHEGLWNAQDRWFRSLFIVRGAGDPWWVLPIFPGGYTIGFMLLFNLIAAHVKRFQWSQKKIGINLTHFGIIIMLVGGLATDLLQKESHMRFREGESKNFSEAHRANELVFMTDADKGTEKVVSIAEELVAKKGEINQPELPFTVRVKDYSINSDIVDQKQVQDAVGKLQTAIATVQSQYATAEGLAPQAERAKESAGRVEVWKAALAAVGENDASDLVAAAKRVAADPAREGKLREELKSRFQAEMLARFSQQGGAMKVAAEQLSKKDGTPAALPPSSEQGAGKTVSAFPKAEAKDMDSRNVPFAVIEIVPRNGQSLGTWLVHPFLEDQEFTVDGVKYRTSFRFERVYYPFSVTLLKTTHETYQGTVTASNPQGIPKNFQSRVRINNPQTGEAREADIYMNNPLRYAGLTFYQYQMGSDEIRGSEVGTSTLQVVRNPSWLAPYLGCIVVGLGMAWQFLYHLFGFMRKRNAPAPSTEKSRSQKKGGKKPAPATVG